MGLGLRHAGFQSRFPLSAFLRSEKAEYSAILQIILWAVCGHYRQLPEFKANIPPLLFARPTFPPAHPAGLPGRLAIFINGTP
ncbi:protein of unknown function [Aminobacter niigataensis]|nr:protein of unknown function [Aminobacter niigataensis]